MADQETDQIEAVEGEKPALAPAPAQTRATRPWHIWADFAISLTVCFTAFLWLIGLSVWHDDLRIAWPMEAAIATVALISSGWVARRQYAQWIGPLVNMTNTLSLIHNGEAPIEELRTIGGGLSTLVPVMQDLLHEMRRREAHIAQLEHEMSQRIANRTDALERMVGTLRHKAARDALTGLYNRRMLDECLPQFLDKCRNDAAPLSLLMIDVDHFKLVNDTLGHAAGYLLLKTIGQLVSSSIRDNDLAFRYGGDEFVILLPGSPVRNAAALAQRLSQLVESFTKTMKLAKHPRLSTGVTEADMVKDTSTTLIHRADALLYQIKAARHSCAA